MKNHIVLQVLNDLGINSEQDINSRVSEMSADDFDGLADRLNDWYAANQSFIGEIRGTVFDFWIPTAPEKNIQRVTSNLLFADSIILSDPLFDYVNMAGSHLYLTDLADWAAQEKHTYICPECRSQMELISAQVYRKKIINVLAFYFKSRPLIETNKIMPFVDAEPKPRHIFDAPLEELFSSYDNDLLSLRQISNSYVSSIKELSHKSHHNVNEQSKPLYIEGFDFAIEKYLALLGVEDIFYGNLVTAPSIDYLGQISGNILDALFRFLQKSTATETKHELTVPTTTSHLMLPTLNGIPVQDIPEILHKERDSLEQFKASLEEKTLSLSEPYGSPAWEKQIGSIRASIQRDLLELEKTMKHIRNDHLRRQASNISIFFFSVGLASLALLHQSMDPLSAIQSIASGAGLSSSAKGIVDAWINYRKDVDEQKRKDIYYLWKLQSQKG